jgi:hypothetical protein
MAPDSPPSPLPPQWHVSESTLECTSGSNRAPPLVLYAISSADLSKLGMGPACLNSDSPYSSFPESKDVYPVDCASRSPTYLYYNASYVGGPVSVNFTQNALQPVRPGKVGWEGRRSGLLLLVMMMMTMLLTRRRRGWSGRTGF